MTSELVRRYRELLDDLVLARDRVGGTLSQEEESRRVGDIDLVWMKMTEDEQNECDVLSAEQYGSKENDVMEELKAGTEQAMAQHRQWVGFSLGFFVAASLGCKTEKEVRDDIEKAFDEARAARRFIIEQGGLHVGVEDISFPRPSLSLVSNEPSVESAAQLGTPAPSLSGTIVEDAADDEADDEEESEW